MRDIVILHVQIAEVGGESQVANVCDPIIVEVEDSEVPARGEVTLEREFKSGGGDYIRS